MNEPLPSLAPLLHGSLIGAIALCLFGGVALGQSTPAGFSLIPGGSFAMGVTSGDTDSNAPSITVRVNPFYIQQTETTKAQWDEVRTWAVNNGYTNLAPGAGKAPNHPVHSVTWWDVVKWCNARSEKEGLTPVYTVGGEVMRTGTTEPTAHWSASGYRLPTEAEWEKAARGGVSGKRFPWGTDTISHAEANYYGDYFYYAYDLTTNSNYHPTYRTGEQPYTSPVGSFEANGYGLYDMAGNVMEWSWDWYGVDYYTTSNGTTDPRGPASGSLPRRMLRGGSWDSSAFLARCALRYSDAPGNPYGNNGFRPARSVILDEMVLIPGGSFTMGRTSGDTDADAPPTTVTVSPFYIQQTETTKAQWDEVRTWGLSNGYTDLEAGAGKASNHPVQMVTWWDVVKWCNARSEKEGLTPVYTVGGGVMRTGTTEPAANWSANGYRLPTEAEWEKAARGGVEGKRFPWGTDTISHAQANYYGDSAYAYDLSPFNNYHPTYRTGEQPYTSPVGSFEANGYGLYDMAGNVWECCGDWYGVDYYTTSNGTTDPRGAAAGSRRVYRGGSWIDYAIIGRAALRYSDAPGVRSGSIGFRPARSGSPRPDAMVGSSLAFMGGTNVYASARSQQVALVSQKARPVFGYVSAANRGSAADRIALRSIGVSRFFAIDYRNAQGSLVTAAVKAGTYLTPELEPDDPADWLEAKITPVKKLIQVKNRNTLVTLRKVHTVLIQANSVLDPAVGDGVSIRVETR